MPGLRTWSAARRCCRTGTCACGSPGWARSGRRPPGAPPPGPAGWAGGSEGGCPPTFRAGYLPAGATPEWIDFILTAGEVTVESTALVFAGKEPLGYVSDHIGLRGRLSLTPIG